MQEVLQANQQRQPAAPPPMSIASQAVPGWQPPGNPFYRPTVPNPQAYPQVFQPQTAANEEIFVEMPTPAAPVAVIEPEKPAAEPEKPAEETENDANAPSLTHCPNCKHDLSQPTVAEPSHFEKQTFLQSVLGQKAFLKDYTLLGGALRVTFRTLTTQEVDAIYSHVLWMQQKGEIDNSGDYWEMVNRYRFYLQLVRLESSQFQVDLPEGLKPACNSAAKTFYTLPEPKSPRDQGLGAVEEYILHEVIKTEMLQRALSNTCNNFNRLVAKLEVLIDNSDFWNRTDTPS